MRTKSSRFTHSAMKYHSTLTAFSDGVNATVSITSGLEMRGRLSAYASLSELAWAMARAACACCSRMPKYRPHCMAGTTSKGTVASRDGLMATPCKGLLTGVDADVADGVDAEEAPAPPLAASARLVLLTFNRPVLVEVEGADAVAVGLLEKNFTASFEDSHSLLNTPRFSLVAAVAVAEALPPAPLPVTLTGSPSSSRCRKRLLRSASVRMSKHRENSFRVNTSDVSSASCTRHEHTIQKQTWHEQPCNAHASTLFAVVPAARVCVAFPAR